MILLFSESRPAPLPAVQMSPAEIEQVQRRYEDFMDAVRGGRHTPPLILTGDDINALIASDRDLRPLKGKVYVTIEGERLKGQVSVPLTDLGLSVLFRSRYLNGTGTFLVSLRHGVLLLSPDVIVVKGKPLPSLYLDQLRRRNLAQHVEDNPRVSIALDKLESIEVKDGKLIVTPKAGP